MKYLSLDIRALALMRICLAMVIMADLSIRLTDLEAFYTDTGAVPLGLVFNHTWNPWFFSFHTLSGRIEVQALLFFIAFIFACLMFIGFRTRLFTFLSWLMLLSLHNRNELILQGGDDLLRMILFWSIFLPMGKAWSCDAIMQAKEAPKQVIRSVAGIAYMLQITALYTGSALLKGPEWHTHHSALYYVYSLDQLALFPTTLIYHSPQLMEILTAIAWYFELLVPVLFFLPVWHSRARLIAFILIFGFHFINLTTLFIGLFPLIGIATAVGLLPSFIFDKLEKYFAVLGSIIRESFHGYALALTTITSWRPAISKPPRINRFHEIAMIFLTLYMVDWNISHYKFFPHKLGDGIRFIGYTLRLDQCWGMFSPGVFKDDGWYVYEAVTKDGEVIDLLNSGQPVCYDKPNNILSRFRNDRWRKYGENMLMTYNEFMRGYFCNYTRRTWNANHPRQKIDTLRIIYMLEFTEPEYNYSEPSKEVLWECYN